MIKKPEKKVPLYMSIARDGQHDLQMNQPPPRSYVGLVLLLIFLGAACMWIARAILDGVKS